MKSARLADGYLGLRIGRVGELFLSINFISGLLSSFLLVLFSQHFDRAVLLLSSGDIECTMMVKI